MRNPRGMAEAASRWCATGSAAIAVGIALVTLTGCSRADQREAEKKAAEAAEQAGAAVEKARDSASAAASDASKAAEGAAATAKDAAAKYGAEAKDAALKGASAAAALGSEAAVTAGRATEQAAVKAAGALRTGAIRAALLRDSSLDVSNVDVTTDEPGKRVTLDGRVRTAGQRAAVERIAKGKAAGYTVENRLKIAG